MSAYTRRPKPGGSRAPNHSGSVRLKTLVSGELRYHARLYNKFLGSFLTRREAQAAIDAARAAHAATEGAP